MFSLDRVEMRAGMDFVVDMLYGSNHLAELNMLEL